VSSFSQALRAAFVASVHGSRAYLVLFYLGIPLAALYVFLGTRAGQQGKIGRRKIWEKVQETGELAAAKRVGNETATAKRPSHLLDIVGGSVSVLPRCWREEGVLDPLGIAPIPSALVATVHHSLGFLVLALVCVSGSATYAILGVRTGQQGNSKRKRVWLRASIALLIWSLLAFASWRLGATF
jgi:hypothetical protein